jgi:hypothetical protein
MNCVHISARSDTAEGGSTIKMNVHRITVKESNK